MDVENAGPVSGYKRKVDEISGGAHEDDATRKEMRGESGAVAISRPVAIISGGDAAVTFNEQYLKYFYAKLFPFKLMFKWLAYGNDPDSPSDSAFITRDFFNRRELCFTMADDVFIRYQCFRDADDFAKAVRARQPYKIDIGPVMNVKPSMHATVKKMEFLQRELVFDIDMDAYDDIRTCCKGATVCPRCWSFVNVAVKTMDSVLRDDFGFSDILFVYSGRRGMHCWVCDPAARTLDNGARAAVVEYIAALSPGVGEGGMDKGVPSIAKTASSLTVPLHPALVRAYAELEPMFEADIISESGQGLLSTPEAWEKILDIIPTLDEGGPDLKGTLRSAWERARSPAQRWKDLKNLIASSVELGGGSVSKSGKNIFGAVGSDLLPAVKTSAKPFKLKNERKMELEKIIPAIVFTYTYPRLDVEVSKSMNHLLKAPFCVHPKTGRVCVPIDVATVDSFDPLRVPTVAQLVQEGTIYTKTVGQTEEAKHDGSVEDGIAWHTSLQPYLEKFQSFVRGCETSSLRARRLQSEKAGAFGDF